MMKNDNGINCQLGCLLIGAAAGILAIVLLWAIGEFMLVQAVFLGALVGIALTGLLMWLFCSELPQLGEIKPGQAGKAPGSAGVAPGSASAQAAADSTAVSGISGAAAAPAGQANSGGSGGGASGASSSGGGAGGSSKSSGGASGGKSAGPAKAKSSDAAVVKPSAELKGEAELSERKGEWSYDKGSDADGSAESSSAGSGSAGGGASGGTSGGSATPEAAAGEGTKPTGLSEAREGGADNLKEIKGVGPALEKLCHELGFFHFDQIASWGADEVAWMDQNLKGFKGRVTRDNWVEQAKILAAGGETEFSKRVDEGDVY
ncbi:endonuclease [Roseobacteraceae bacterium S113]